ncbi:MAG: hypothetical protein HFJ60_06575 [Clostridia bacterium]|nr:hypothetical protein [Clostridia bacterium]
MNNNKELIEQKSKIIIQKIEKLQKIYEITLQKDNCKESSSLKIIKEQYLKMYNAIIEKEEYDRYKEVEDIIINEIAKIELNLDEYIYNTRQDSINTILNRIQEIKESENYQNFHNIKQYIEKVETLKDILKLYKPYIKNEEYDKIKKDIINLKFELLYRKQVEELIYENGGETSYLIQYDNEEEKNLFINLLKEKIGEIENDDILKVKPERILEDVKLLERLIIIHMQENSLKYINLLNAKIFNAHLCNIGNNPFDEEVYYKEIKERKYEPEPYKGYYPKMNILKDYDVEYKANKVNFSLLRAILKELITDENVSLVECVKLYEKFGFQCVPKTYTTGQKCIYMLYNTLNKSEECNEMMKIKQTDKKEVYCKIELHGMSYKFDAYDVEKINEYNKIQILREREVNNNQPKKRSLEKKQEEEKEEIKRTGRITTDCNILISLIQDIIQSYKDDRKNIETNRKVISAKESMIKILEEIKEKKKLSKNDIWTIQKSIYFIYSELNINFNMWELRELENIDALNFSNKSTYYSQIPREQRYENRTVGHTYGYGFEYEKVLVEYLNKSPLYAKYEKEFKELGLDIKLYDLGDWVKEVKYRGNEPRFGICINLDDISDLPIDYEKVELIPEEKMKEIMEREKGIDRE